MKKRNQPGCAASCLCSAAPLNPLFNCTVTAYTGICSAVAEAGITITFTQGGVTVATGTTNSSGYVTAVIPPGVSTTATCGAPSRGTPGTLTFTSCTANHTQTVVITCAPAAGYHCPCEGTSYPAADTLYITDSIIGVTVTLTWNGSYWDGTGSYAYPGCGSGGITCAPKTTTLAYSFSKPVAGHCDIVFAATADAVFSPCPGTTGGSGAAGSFDIRNDLGAYAVTSWTPTGGLFGATGTAPITGTKVWSTNPTDCNPVASTTTITVTE